MKNLQGSLKVFAIIGACLGVMFLFFMGAGFTLEKYIQSQSKPQVQTAAVASVHIDKSPVINLETVASDVNIQRTAYNLQPLERNAYLDKSAQEKCADMVTRNYWAHNTPGGPAFESFIGKYVLYDSAGENLAEGYANAVSLVNGWMKSPGHKENILRAEFTIVGYAQCEYPANSIVGESTLVVQHFANLQ